MKLKCTDYKIAPIPHDISNPLFPILLVQSSNAVLYYI